MASSWVERISGVKEADLRDLIKSITPHDETYFGKKFLFSLIDQKGLYATIQFIQKAKKAIEDEDGLDLDFNFDPDERRIFWKTSLNYMKRDEFLEVFGWAIPGVFYFGVKGIFKGLLTLHHRKEPEPNATPAEKAYHEIEQYGDPVVEILIGAALTYTGFKNRKIMGLEQIRDTINEISKQIEPYYDSRTRGGSAALPSS